MSDIIDLLSQSPNNSITLVGKEQGGYSVIDSTYELTIINATLEKIQVKDVDTKCKYIIIASYIDELIKHDYSPLEAVDILTTIHERFKECDEKLSFKKITAALLNIIDSYPSPEWLIKEIKNLPYDDMESLFKSDNTIQVAQRLFCSY